MFDSLGKICGCMLAARGLDSKHPAFAGCRSILPPSSSKPVWDPPEEDSLTQTYLRNVDPGTRKRQGQFFTPPRLVSSILSHVLDRSARLPASILDPGCGTGAFLLGILAHYPRRDPIDLLRRLVGVEIDPLAASITRFRLILALTDRLGRSALDRLAENNLPQIVEGDFLDREFTLPRAHFGRIIGNPPYVRIENTQGDRAARLRETYETARGKFDLSVVFLERSLELLAPRGRLAFILSGKFRTQNYGRVLREKLCRTTRIDSIDDLTNRFPFPGVGAAPVVLTLTRTPPPPDHRVRCGDRTLDQHRLGAAPWTDGRVPQEILDALSQGASSRLGQEISWAGYEVITGCNEAFVAESTLEALDAAGVEPAHRIPFLRSCNLDGLTLRWSGRIPRKETYLVYPHDPHGHPLKSPPPGVARFLSTYREQLEARRDWRRISYRESPRRRWYELHQVHYVQSQPKLLCLRNAKRATTLYRPLGDFIAGDRFHAYCLAEPTDLRYRLFWLILNSSLADLWVRAHGTQIYAARPDQEPLYEYEKKFLVDLPIRLPGRPEQQRWFTLSMQLEEKIATGSSLEGIRSEINERVLAPFGLSPDCIQKALEELCDRTVPPVRSGRLPLSISGSA